GTPLSLGQRPNELWCTDYKGEFLLGNHHYCYPLTVTDHASRFLLTCEALSSTCENYAFTVFERLFQERGLPANIRSDNGVPFASAHVLFNLTKLPVWWLRLGIGIEGVQDDIWLVTFMDYDLGYFDLETRVLEPLENPFGPKVLPM